MMKILRIYGTGATGTNSLEQDYNLPKKVFKSDIFTCQTLQTLNIATMSSSLVK